MNGGARMLGRYPACRSLGRVRAAIDQSRGSLSTACWSASFTGDMTRDGCWAERVAVGHRILAATPDRLSFGDAASLPLGSLTAWEAVFRDQGELPSGVDRVLILGGAGGVGSMATQILKAMTPAFVIGTGSRAESKAWSEKMGANMVLDHGGDIAEQLASAGFA